MMRIGLLFLCVSQSFSLCGQNLWGVNSQGGPGGGGVIFSTNKNGSNYQSRYSFSGGNSGRHPQHVTPRRIGDKVYGVTFRGGGSDLGVLFEYDFTTGAYTVFHEFGPLLGGANPYSSLTVFDGKLFGTTLYGGLFGRGTIFELNPTTGQFHKYFDFGVDVAEGMNPFGTMTEANNLLYGLASGGDHPKGVLYEFDPSINLYVRKLQFSGTDGSKPQHGMVLGADGKLYGTTTEGGAFNKGVIFSYVPGATSVTKLFDFESQTGSFPIGEMIFHNNLLYGMTAQEGAAGYGTLYSFDPSSGTYDVKFDFAATGGNMNGCNLMLSQTGIIYGMTTGIGMHTLGTIFKFDPANDQLTFLHHFNDSEGRHPGGGLAELPSGLLYGLCESGGSTNSGTIFTFNPASNTHTTLIELQTGTARPVGEVSFYDGKLYGITLDGGPIGFGTLFEFDTATHVLSELALFDGTNGSVPQGGLANLGNKFYGTTRYGGTQNVGTIFSYDFVEGEFTSLANFGDVPQLEYPQGQLFADGTKLFGLTNGGIPAMFQYDIADARLSRVISLPAEFFANQPSGLMSTFGRYYGTCRTGGTGGGGFIYEYRPINGSMTVLRSFQNQDGMYPTGNMVEKGASLYGLTESDGAFGSGTIYEFNPVSFEYNVVYNFQPGPAGSKPQGALMVGPDGLLYGMTVEGGANDLGVVFKFHPGTHAYTKTSDFSSASGHAPQATRLFNSAMGLVPEVTSTGETGTTLKVYPNPASNLLYLQGVDQQSTKFMVLDPLGREVAIQTVQQDSYTVLNLHGLAGGVYYVRCQGPASMEIVRFVKR